MCQGSNVGSTTETLQNIAPAISDCLSQLTPGFGQANNIVNQHDETDVRQQPNGDRPTATVQRLPEGQPIKLKWSKAKQEQSKKREENWGTNDELEALANIYGIKFVLFETAQAVVSQQISIGEDDSPTFALFNSDNRHFDALVP